MHILLLIILATLALMSISLQRAYAQIPIRELKHRIRDGDEVAALLYRAAAYGHSLRAVLWFLVGITNAAFFIQAALYIPAWLAFAMSAILIWIGFVWLPSSDVKKINVRIASRLAPIFAWFLSYLHPILDRIFLFIRRLRPINFHTGLYDREDLLKLLENQQVQADNRIEEAELEIAKRALTFGSKIIRDVMVPPRVVKTVAANEIVGPVLMDELHSSGHSRFPVYEGSKNKADSFVGMLLLRDLINAKEGGKVSDFMHKGVLYLHEEQTLYEALQAILKTRHHLFIVVNSFEEYVGIISIEDVFEQIIGKPIVDEFDQYEDLRSVASKAAKLEHQEHHEKPSSEITEVIE